VTVFDEKLKLVGPFTKKEMKDHFTTQFQAPITQIWGNSSVSRDRDEIIETRSILQEE
jgi:hypothetical protein